MNVNKDIEKAKSLHMDKNDEWLFESREISIVIEELGEGVRPSVLVCLSLSTGMIVGSSVVPPDPSNLEVLPWIVECMLRPAMGKPYRPGSVNLIGENLEHVGAALQEMGIKVSMGLARHPYMDEVMSELESAMGGRDMPPYITGSKLTPESVSEFFSAASDFYKFQPWRLFDYETPAKVKLKLKKPVTYWAVVMGMSGDEFGVSLFRTADDLLNMFNTETDEEALQVAEQTWTMGFTYDDFDEIGLTAQGEYLSHEWPLPDPSVYPSALVVDPKPDGQVRRPSETELLHLTAVTRALTEFLRIYRKQIGDREYVEDDTLQVEMSGKSVGVSIALPAPEFLLDESSDQFEE